MKTWLRRLRRDPKLLTWLSAGITGGSSGASAVGWFLWGPPTLLTSSLCFLLTGPLAFLVYLFVCAMGVSFVILLLRLVRVIRQIRRPLSISMYEPPEPFIEMEVIAWPHPGCGLLIFIPLILLSGTASLPWLWFGALVTPLVPLLLLLAGGIAAGIWIAKREVKHW